MALRQGTVLDGEAVIWRGGRLDFGAAQSRAASSVTGAWLCARERVLAQLLWLVTFCCEWSLDADY